MQSNSSPTVTNCPVCAGKVSTDAKICPHCGHPLKSPKDIIQHTKERLIHAKAKINETAKAAHPHIQNAAQSLENAAIKVLKFVVWFFIAGTLGIVGKLFCDAFARQYVLCVIYIMLFPAIVSIPMLLMARKLVCNGFAKVISVLCAIHCFPSATILFENAERTNDTVLDCGCQIVGAFIALLWTIYFLRDKSETKASRVLKHVLITIYTLGLIAHSYFVITESMR